MSYIERLNLMCPLFGVSFKRGSTLVYNYDNILVYNYDNI